MIHIHIENFCGSAYCRSQQYSAREAFLPITYHFLPGKVYGLISDFGCGSWALSCCLGGRGEAETTGTLFVNNQAARREDLAKHACFVGEKTFEGVNFEQNLLSAAECIQKALDISKLNYTPEEIKKMFDLSSERFHRDLASVSGEIYPISTAIGFSLGKEIFCYPWMNTHDAARHLDKKLFDILKANNKTILLPACRGLLKTPFKKQLDCIIDLHAYNAKYYALSSEEKAKLKRVRGW